MKTESTIGKLQSKAIEVQDYHRQASVGTISESLKEREADTIRVRQSKKDHVYAVIDNQGELLEHYRYTAFGEREIYSPQTENKLEGTAIANPVLWNSRRYDEQTDLYYYKYRHYKADIGRWLGRDPIEELGGINLYGFVGNEPIGRWDVLGLSWTVEGVLKCLCCKTKANPNRVKYLDIIKKYELISFDKRKINGEEFHLDGVATSYVENGVDIIKIFIKQSLDNAQAYETLVEEAPKVTTGYEGAKKIDTSKFVCPKAVE